MAFCDDDFTVDGKKQSELRILLVGRTGHGKSATCNTLIGDNLAQVSSASTSTTTKCRLYRAANRFNRNLEIVDTPGIFDTANDNATIHKELIRSLLLTTPGFHAIAFVLRKDKFTQEIQETKDIFFNWFGENVKNHSFVILTDTSTTDEMNEFLKERPHKKLTELVNDCSGRVVPLQNKCKSDSSTRDQIIDIFDMVEQIIAENKNTSFSNGAFMLAKLYAEKQKSLSNSMLLLFSKKFPKMSLPSIQNETVRHIIEQQLSSESDVIEETERNTAKLEIKGNITIIDSLTDKPYKNPADTLLESTSNVPVLSKKQTPMENVTSWESFETEDDINANKTPIKDVTSSDSFGTEDEIKETKLSIEDDFNEDSSYYNFRSEMNIDENNERLKRVTAWLRRVFSNIPTCTII